MPWASGALLVTAPTRPMLGQSSRLRAIIVSSQKGVTTVSLLGKIRNRPRERARAWLQPTGKPRLFSFRITSMRTGPVVVEERARGRGGEGARGPLSLVADAALWSVAVEPVFSP